MVDPDSPSRAAPITPFEEPTLSTTLSTHPPQQTEALLPHGEPEAPRLTSRRPSALDKLALRLGLLLITYGRRRYARSREDLAQHWRIETARRAHELEWDRDCRLAVPPR